MSGIDDVTPVNTVGIRFMEVIGIDIAEWHPLPNGEGRPTQVHMRFDVADFPYPMIMRFMSRRPVDQLIVALMTHANAVWPNPESINNKKERVSKDLAACVLKSVEMALDNATNGKLDPAVADSVRRQVNNLKKALGI